MLHNKEIEIQKDQAQALIASRVDIPEGYKLTSHLLQSHDEVPVFIFRYEKSNGKNTGLGGEHFSVSVDLGATKIMGVMHVDETHCGEGLPNDDDAQDAAIQWLPKIAPELVDQYEVKWILSQKEEPEKIPHECPFPFKDDEGKEHLVTGVRVKLFFQELDSWGWVIVGRDGQIISFEREVIWNTTLSRRSTPAWLHDNYIQELMSDINRI